MKTISKIFLKALKGSVAFCLFLFLATAVLTIVPGAGRWFGKHVLVYIITYLAYDYREEAIREGDVEAAFKYTKIYSDAGSKRHKREIDINQNRPLYTYCYELAGEYDKAIECCNNRPGLESSEVNSNFIDRTWEHDKSRLLYKKGLKKEAFIAYCSFPPRPFDPPRDTRGNHKEQRMLVTLQGHRVLESLSCFKTYDEFLNFLDEEYEKLGRPEEYAEAVARYHAIAEDEPKEEHKEKKNAPVPAGV